MKRILIEVDVPEETFATPVWYEALDALSSTIEGKVVGVFFSGRKPTPVDAESTRS